MASGMAFVLVKNIGSWKIQLFSIFTRDTILMIDQAEIGKRIAAMRKHKGYSQEKLAELLEMPRTSLAQIELGNRNITAGELIQLSTTLEFSLDRFLGPTFAATTNTRQSGSDAQPIRVAVPELQKKKFKDLLLYVLERCAGKPNVGETVLNKLIYFIEFNYYERYEEHLIGATFKKLPFGPVPVDMSYVMMEMEDEGLIQKFDTRYYNLPQKRFLPLEKPDLKIFNAAEIEIIDQVLGQFSDYSASGISDYSHKDMPWRATKDGEVIDYELAFYREPPFSARVYDNNEQENGL
jgi:transcriptional regulator with XRE-family HTH domain